MKQKFLSFLSAITLTMSVNAAVLTVSNNTNSPGQYTDLQAAIDASQPYDTLLVAGSPTSYGNITISWPLTIFGAGYNNPYGQNTTVGNVEFRRVNATVSASGSKLSGVVVNRIHFHSHFSGGNPANQWLDNIVVERCQIGESIYQATPPWSTQAQASLNNISFRNNLFKGTTVNIAQYTSFNNVLFHNNIMDNFTIWYPNAVGSMAGMKIQNNVFINRTSANFTSSSSSVFDGLVVENNIFYGVWPEGCRNCTFNNNITYQCNNDNLIYAGNPGSVGSGNIIGQNPLFESYPTLGGAFQYTYDLRLKPASPGKDAGTDGTDIGMYGGLLPFEQIGKNPNIPQMEWINFIGNSSVPVGGTLNIEFKSHKQD